MRTYTIKKGTHRGKPFQIGLFVGSTRLIREVQFMWSCRYYLPEEDQADVNKLFGIGYLWSHHKNSARFGWSYNTLTEVMDLYAYCYDNGERTSVYITSVQIGEKVKCELQAYRGSKDYLFIVYREDGSYVYRTMKKSHHKWIGFPLGLYFGGNRRAPETIKIQMKKL